MKDLKWKDEYALGIFAIDLQHQRIFDCLVALAALVPGKRVSALPDVSLLRLVARVQEHFAIEESMMRTLSYPGLDRHAGEHRQFHAQVQDLVQACAVANGNPPQATIKALQQWLRDHIMTSDRRYLDFFAGLPRKDAGKKAVAVKRADAPVRTLPSELCGQCRSIRGKGGSAAFALGSRYKRALAALIL